MYTHNLIGFPCCFHVTPSMGRLPLDNRLEPQSNPMLSYYPEPMSAPHRERGQIVQKVQKRCSNGAESALTAPKLDRPSLSFGTGADSADSAGKLKKLFEGLRPKNNLTPCSDAGSGTAHSDYSQQLFTTNIPYLWVFRTIHEVMFLKQHGTDSAISAEVCDISRRISDISPRPAKAGPTDIQL